MPAGVDPTLAAQRFPLSVQRPCCSLRERQRRL